MGMNNFYSRSTAHRFRTEGNQLVPIAMPSMRWRNGNRNDSLRIFHELKASVTYRAAISVAGQEEPCVGIG